MLWGKKQWKILNRMSRIIAQCVFNSKLSGPINLFADLLPSHDSGQPVSGLCLLFVTATSTGEQSSSLYMQLFKFKLIKIFSSTVILAIFKSPTATYNYWLLHFHHCRKFHLTVWLQIIDSYSLSKPWFGDFGVVL